MFKGFVRIFQNTYFFKHLSLEAFGLLTYALFLQTNYNFTINVIHYPYLKTISKIIPLNQHKFRILNQSKEARPQLGEYEYENMRTWEWPHTFETPPIQPDYPWFSKCTLNLGLEKAMLINSANMSHLPPFSHWSNMFVFIKKTISWKFQILSSKNFRVVSPWIL